MRFLSLIPLLLLNLSLSGQPVATITVHAGASDRADCPVGIPLSTIDYNEDQGPLVLKEIRNDGTVPVPCQMEYGHSATLWFILGGMTPAGSSRQYIIERGDAAPPEGPVSLEEKHGLLQMEKEGRPVLGYQFRTVWPPEGISPLFKRSGFIHPLWSPGGEVLTRIQPPDHYHHYGIWGPWTKTHINGREVDFWNLNKGEGTVRFSGFISRQEGPVYSGFRALQEHVDFGAPGEDRLAISEVLDVRVWNTGNEQVWLIDYTTTLNTPLDSGIILDAYRYGGGIGFRATERWHRDNSTVLTSEQNDRLTADGTKARWCMVEGESGSGAGRSGILFMGHPSNREFPEPMRVWPVDANGGRGDLYFEFCPIRHNPWVLEKGKDYALKYRLLVFDGSLSEEAPEQYWRAFGEPPQVEINARESNEQYP